MAICSPVAILGLVKSHAGFPVRRPRFRGIYTQSPPLVPFPFLRSGLPALEKGLTLPLPGTRLYAHPRPPRFQKVDFPPDLITNGYSQRARFSEADHQ